VTALPCCHALPPWTVQEALARPDAARLQQANVDEITSCLEFDVWEATELPEGKQALPSHFVLDHKRNGQDKARLAAGGHRQQHGIDFDEPFALFTFTTQCVFYLLWRRERVWCWCWVLEIGYDAIALIGRRYSNRLMF
jgi:hypothetical protein